MTDEHDDRLSTGKAGRMGWGIPASVLVHLVLGFVLFFHMPLESSEAQKEESVSVEIVPPPEPPEKKEEAQKKLEIPKFDDKKEEAKKAEEKKPEEKKPETPPPPKQEEAKKPEPPPPAPKPEEAKKEPPLPPPAPKQEAKKEEPPPEPKKQEEAKQEPPPKEEEAKPQHMQEIDPVFQFGDKDSGPRQSNAGNSAADSSTSPAETDKDAKPVEPEKPVAEPPKAVAETPPGNPVPDDITVPEIGVASANPQHSGPAAGPAPDALRMDIVMPPKPSQKREPSKTPTTTAGKSGELKEAKTLFSRSASNDPTATVAMAGMSRGERAGALCVSELGSQLAAMSYPPKLLPQLQLQEGTVLERNSVGVPANGQWYDVAFRCEIDNNATKVLSFAFHVGQSVPRSEWRKRNFPNVW